MKVSKTLYRLICVYLSFCLIDNHSLKVSFFIYRMRKYLLEEHITVRKII